jgi:hypothetical protein
MAVACSRIHVGNWAFRKVDRRSSPHSLMPRLPIILFSSLIFQRTALAHRTRLINAGRASKLLPTGQDSSMLSEHPSSYLQYKPPLVLGEWPVLLGHLTSLPCTCRRCCIRSHTRGSMHGVLRRLNYVDCFSISPR